MGLPKTWSLNELLTSADLNAQFVYCNALIPVGVPLPFLDFNATVTFDTDIYCYMAGQTISDVDSPLNGKVIPDMSNRYLVGLGSEGGQDIGSVAWSDSVVGLASHIGSFAHDHNISHVHSGGSLQFETGNILLYGGGIFLNMYDINGNAYVVNREQPSNWVQTGSGGNPSDIYPVGSDVTLYTKDGGTAGVTSSSSLSDTGSANWTTGVSDRSIQVRSIPCRYIIRYK